MRKFIQNILAASIVLGSASTVFAQQGTRSGGYYSGSTYGSSVAYGTPNEIITNFTSGSLLAGQSCKDCDNVTNITVRAMYLRTFSGNVQIGAQAGLESVSGDNSETLLTLVGMGVYNFDTNFKEAFFVQGGLGIYPVLKDDGSGDHESKFGFLVGGGKRFPIWGNVNYIPTASLVKKGDLDIGFDIEFLNFSIMF